MIDSNTLALRSGVAVSYLTEEQQYILADFIETNNITLNMQKADLLKSLAQSDDFSLEKLEEIFIKNKDNPKGPKPKVYKINYKKYEKYFKEEKGQKEFEEILEKALEVYFSNLNEENPTEGE